jgi:protein phosphatase
VKTEFRWQGTGLTDIGLVRASNQDAFAVRNDLGLWVIADGMGGHAGGDVASQLAVKTTTLYWEERTAQDRPTALGGNSQAQVETRLRASVMASHQAIRLEAMRHPWLADMGTTIVTLLITDEPRPCAAIAHVGDSRAYLLRAKALTQLTQDHSVVEERFRKGLITREQALSHPHRHVLSQALGIDAQVQPDITMYPLEQDDWLLLCTDGLTRTLDDPLIAHALLHAGHSADTICRHLIEEANARGGSDNTTVIVVAATRLPGSGRSLSPTHFP